jgi:hypothetical protein
MGFPEGKEFWNEIVKYHYKVSNIFLHEDLPLVKYESVYEDWVAQLLLNTEKENIKMFRYWKENNPSKKCLESIKYCINKYLVSKDYYCVRDRRSKKLPDNYIFNCYCKYLINSEYIVLNEEEIFEMLDLLIYFGADVNLGDNKATIFKKFIKTTRLNQLFNEVESGRKIVNFMKDKLDDEFEMKPLRTKIDMRKILEVEEKRRKLEE